MTTKYTTEQKLAENIKEQKVMNISSLNRLLKTGFQENEFQDFDFYFYSNEIDKLNLLGDELQQLGYNIDEIEESSEDSQFFISGTAPNIQLNLQQLNNWVERMCKIAYKYDCEFSGWESQA